MTNIQELIETTTKLVHNLDLASENEKQFTVKVCLEFERMSWELYRMTNDLKSIKEYCGV